MTRKDLSPVDLETAAPATGTMSRRRLVAGAGLAGLAGALFVDRRVFAAVDDPAQTDERPNVPTDADSAVLDLVIGFELAVSELYRRKLEAGTGSDALADAVGVMAENHQAYAQAIAGATGLSAGEANPSLVAALRNGFEGSDEEFFAAAHEVEQAAVSTHTDALGNYESNEAILVTASILIAEARHATVLADLLGVDDLDVLFGNEQGPLSLTGGDS
jgi:hypothetical protein